MIVLSDHEAEVLEGILSRILTRSGDVMPDRSPAVQMVAKRKHRKTKKEITHDTALRLVKWLGPAFVDFATDKRKEL